PCAVRAVACVPYRCSPRSPLSVLFFFTDPATTEIYTLSLHDALPILLAKCASRYESVPGENGTPAYQAGGYSPGSTSASPAGAQDRKSTRLNSSHVKISYAVFCLKKKTKKRTLRSCEKIGFNALYRM